MNANELELISAMSKGDHILYYIAEMIEEIEDGLRTTINMKYIDYALKMIDISYLTDDTYRDKSDPFYLFIRSDIDDDNSLFEIFMLIYNIKYPKSTLLKSFEILSNGSVCECDFEFDDLLKRDLFIDELENLKTLGFKVTEGL